MSDAVIRDLVRSMTRTVSVAAVTLARRAKYFTADEREAVVSIMNASRLLRTWLENEVRFDAEGKASPPVTAREAYAAIHTALGQSALRRASTGREGDPLTAVAEADAMRRIEGMFPGLATDAEAPHVR